MKSWEPVKKKNLNVEVILMSESMNSELSTLHLFFVDVILIYEFRDKDHFNIQVFLPGW